VAGDDVEDEDEGHRRCRGERRLRPVDGARLRRPTRRFVEGSLFNLEETSSCRFSADAGGGIGPCNSWLMV
jgi:hypothetical protein